MTLTNTIMLAISITVLIDCSYDLGRRFMYLRMLKVLDPDKITPMIEEMAQSKAEEARMKYLVFTIATKLKK